MSTETTGAGRRLLAPMLKDARSTALLARLPTIPAAWALKPGELEAQCLPTPFAQAELMAHVLRAIEVVGKVEDVAPSRSMRQNFDRWQSLVVGIVKGLIEVEHIALGSGEVGALGKMLLQARPAHRYQTVLKDASRNLATQLGSIVGGADPLCFVWCAPGVEDTEWTNFKAMVGDGRANVATTLQAHQTLIEWRAVLLSQGWWDATTVPWQRAMDRMLDGVPASASPLLADHTEFVGPFMLDVAQQQRVVVFLPRVRPGYAEEYKAITHLLAEDTDRDGFVELIAPSLSDDPAVEVGDVQISVAGIAPADASQAAQIDEKGTPAEDLLLAGIGRVRWKPELTDRRVFARARRGVSRLRDSDAAQGYESRVFAPLFQAVERAHRGRGLSVTAQDIDRCPVLFPDPLRLIARHLKTPADKVDVRPTSDAHRVAQSLGRTLEFGTPLKDIDPVMGIGDDVADYIVGLPGTRPARALTEWFTDPQGKRVEVRELRALGLALWVLFADEGTYDGGRVDWTKSETLNASTTSLMSVGNHENSPVFNELAYTAVASQCRPRRGDLDQSVRVRIWARRATLQRFLRTWREAEGESKGARADAGQLGARLGFLAARALVEWVAGGRPLGPAGMPGRRSKQSLTLAAGFEVPLFRDEYSAE